MNPNLPFSPTNDKYDHIYRGIVRNNVDPDQAGKCQIEIWPMFQGATSSDLPWSTPAYPIFEGSGDGIGYFAVPRVGTLVYCFFECGDFNQPVYFAEAPSKVHGIPASSATNYPNRKVMRTSGGIEIYIDDTLNQVTVMSSTGDTFTVDNSGVTITSPFVFVNGNLGASTGASGTFSTLDSKSVSVANGIITDID